VIGFEPEERETTIAMLGCEPHSYQAAPARLSSGACLARAGRGTYRHRLAWRPKRLTALPWLAACILAASPVAAHKLAPAPAKSRTGGAWAVQWQPSQLANGSPVVFQVVPPERIAGLSAKWLEHEVGFTYDVPSKTWYGIAGISLDARPGIYPLELKATTARGAEINLVRRISIRKGKYPSVGVTVAKRFTEPSQEQLERIQQDKTVKQDVFRRTDPVRQWLGGFRPPVDGRVSDVFGTRRTFNGKVQSMHQGLDYAVPQGTPVSAANAGTVLLASSLYFEGNCVVLDHGQGLLTLYLHLSELKVKPGERVEGGQLIGLSGGTGRATGPHLHLAVRWQGIYLNPATLLHLKLP
jgi:murein DD-endopeptidase MepM/ murein hydrolase activator NlpD